MEVIDLEVFEGGGMVTIKASDTLIYILKTKQVIIITPGKRIRRIKF